MVRDDTNQQVVDELRHQQGIEANRLAKVHPQLTKHNSNLCLHYQEKERVASLTEVVQKLEDSQRSNVVRSVQDSVRYLELDELNAVYAFVKNAQLERLQVPPTS